MSEPAPLHSVREGWRIALDQLRANKLRSALTVLGVVIGIATVMAMASIVAGFREQIVNTLGVVGADDRFMEILGGGVSSGRSFTAAELRGGQPIAIVEQRTIDRLFGAVNPLGRVIRIGGHPFKVIGVWQRPTNICEVPGAPEIAAVVPFESARRSFIIDEWNSLIILVKPKPEVSVSRAMDAATVTLRRLRGLRVGDANTFDLLT